MSSTQVDIEKQNRQANIYRAVGMRINENILMNLEQYLFYRQKTAQALLKAKSDTEIEHLNAVYDHCNEKIKLLLAL